MPTLNLFIPLRFSKDDLLRVRCPKQFGLPVLFLVFLVFHEANCQNSKIDSLERLASSLHGQAQVDVLNRLSFTMGTTNNVGAKEAAQKAYQLSVSLHYEAGEAEALINEGIAEFSVGNDPIALKLFRQSLVLSRKLGNRDLEGYALAYVGVEFQNQDLLDSALIYYQRSLEILQHSRKYYYVSFVYLLLSDYYGLKSEPEKQFSYLEKCWSIRYQAHDQFLPFIGQRMAAHFTKKGEYELALQYLKISQQVLGPDTVGSEEINILRQQRAIIYAQQGNYSKALAIFHETKKFYERNAFPLELTHHLLETGEVFQDLGNYETSLNSYFEALKLSEKNHYDFERTKVLIRIGWVYFLLEQYSLSRDFVQKAIPNAIANHHRMEEAAAYNLLGLILDWQNQNDSAWVYYRRALTIRKNIDDKTGIAGSLYNMGVLYEKLNQFDLALQHQLQSLSIEESLNHPIGIAYSLEGLGKLYTRIHDFATARKYLQRAETLARKLKAGAVLVDVYLYKRDLSRAEGNLSEAIRYSILYENVKDSIFNENLSTRVTSLQNAFELDQKDKEILLLNTAQQLQESELAHQKSQLRQQWIILAAVIAGLLLAAAMLVQLFRSNKRMRILNKEIHERNEEIQAQSEELSESNKMLGVLNKELANQKEEMASQNEELIQSNEEVSTQRDLVAAQYTKLEEARSIIEQQNNEITARNEGLEQEVDKRTKELIDYNHQLEQFAFISSHNLRAPVARILGLGQLLDLPNKSHEEETVIRKHLVATAMEMDRVVKDLNTILEVRKNNTHTMTEIDLAEEFNLIRVNLEKEIAETHAAITTDFSEVASIRTVRPYLDSILFNLVSNAVKYRNPLRKPLISLKSRISDGHVCLTVADNGLGINLNLHRDKVFTLYSRFHDHVEGKGLGLYLVKTQVNALGGEIEVESTVGKGTTFHIYFKSN